MKRLRKEDDENNCFNGFPREQGREDREIL
jgi:hypothetical protein